MINVLNFNRIVNMNINVLNFNRIVNMNINVNDNINSYYY